MDIFFIVLIICIISIINIIYNKYANTNENFNLSEANPVMKTSSLIIAGTCRDVGTYIPDIIKSIDRCGEKFLKYHVIIYENDSSDDTRLKLIELKKSNYTYLFEDGLDKKFQSRTKRLAHGRNLILEQLRQMCDLEQWDYLLVLDMDNVNSKGTFVDTIDRCFDPSINKINWAVQAANQKYGYYDRWALRIPKIFNYDCWLKIKKHGRTDQTIKKYVYPDLKFNGDLIPVKSAFGGTALYKIKSIPPKCVYNGTHLKGEEKCEHVDFHKCIKKSGGSIYINTKFINDG